MSKHSPTDEPGQGLAFTVGTGVRQPKGGRADAPGPDLVAAVREQLAELRGLEAWFAGAVFRDDYRSNQNWQGQQLLPLDVDYEPDGNHVQMPPDVVEQLQAVLEFLPGNLAYLTPRGLRVVFVLAKSITSRSQARRALSAAAELVAEALRTLDLRDFHVDRGASVDTARLMFAPNAQVDGEQRRAEVQVLRATPYGVDELPEPSSAHMPNSLPDSAPVQNSPHLVECVRSALDHLAAVERETGKPVGPGAGHDDWFYKVIVPIHDAFGGGVEGRELARNYSMMSAKYPNDDVFDRRWSSLTPGKLGGRHVGSLFHHVRQVGEDHGMPWQPPMPFDELPAAPAVTEESPITTAWPTSGQIWFRARPPDRRYLLHHPDGSGMLPMSKACALSAAGGTGKTIAVVQLALSIVTRRPWLEHYHVGHHAPARVALLLGEEDADEVHRRIHHLGLGLGLDPDEQQAVEEHVIVLPLAGRRCPLLELDRNGGAVATSHLHALREHLEHHAGDGWGLLVLDPMARLCGIDAESDNSLATAFVQEVEALTTVPGSPTVLTVAHSSKYARRQGGADLRGVTAAVDGFRWHATLVNKGPDAATLNVEKNNYSRPSEPLHLVRKDHGLLAAVPDDERRRQEQEAQDRHLDEQTEAVVEIVRHIGGTCRSRETLARQLGGKITVARSTVDIAVERGLLVYTAKTSRTGTYSLPPGDENKEE